MPRIIELPLTPREKRLLRRLLAKHVPDAVIARQLDGKPEQIREQRQRLCQKLRISSRKEIIKAAAQFAPWPLPQSKLAGQGQRAYPLT